MPPLVTQPPRHAPRGGLPLLLQKRSVGFLSGSDGLVSLIVNRGVEPPGGMAGREAIVQMMGFRGQSHILMAGLTEGTTAQGTMHRLRQS
jgi:hypothetical protein